MQVRSQVRMEEGVPWGTPCPGQDVVREGDIPHPGQVPDQDGERYLGHTPIKVIFNLKFTIFLKTQKVVNVKTLILLHCSSLNDVWVMKIFEKKNISSKAFEAF